MLEVMRMTRGKTFNFLEYFIFFMWFKEIFRCLGTQYCKYLLTLQVN